MTFLFKDQQNRVAMKAMTSTGIEVIVVSNLIIVILLR